MIIIITNNNQSDKKKKPIFLITIYNYYLLCQGEGASTSVIILCFLFASFCLLQLTTDKASSIPIGFSCHKVYLMRQNGNM